MKISYDKKAITEKPWKNCYMAKPYCHSKLYETKKFKRIKKSGIPSLW